MRSFGYYKLYHEGIRAAFAPYEKQLLIDMPTFEQQYINLKDAGNDMEAQKVINGFVAEKCDSALKAADKALDIWKKQLSKRVNGIRSKKHPIKSVFYFLFHGLKVFIFSNNPFVLPSKVIARSSIITTAGGFSSVTSSTLISYFSNQPFIASIPPG